MSNRTELLKRAARCYGSAGLALDASRCYESVGDFIGAGHLYEQALEWAHASRCFALAQQWPAAARAHLRAGEPEEAAEAWIKAGESGQAAWLLADECRLFTRARALAQSLSEGSPSSPVERELIIARSDIGQNRLADAARRLRAALRLMPSVGVTFSRDRLDAWALHIAGLLRRPDLTALVHSTSAKAGTAGSLDRWRSWAAQSLGDSSGIPASSAELVPTHTAALAAVET